jgi:O-antigen/teichoic acid export membrane protein
MLKALLRDSVIYTFSTLISRGLSFLLIPLYTRVLTPADYGALDMLIVFGSIVNLTIALEVSQGVARYCSNEKDTHRRMIYASSAFWFTLLCYSTFVSITLIWAPSLSDLIMGTSGLVSVFRIGMIYLGLNGVFILVQNQFRWELKSKSYAAVSLLVSLVTAISAVGLTMVLRWGVSGILWGMIAGISAGSAYGLWFLRGSFRCHFSWAYLKEMLLFSAPLVPSGIAVFVSLYIDRLMISHYLSLTEVGLYGLGFRLSSIVGLIMVGFQSALTPLIYSHYAEEQTPRQLAFVFRFFIALALLMFLTLSLFAQEIIRTFFSPSYYPAKDVIIFIVPAILLSNMYIFAPGIDIFKKTHLILWINLGGAGINTTLNWLMIPHFGMVGAATATLIGSLFVFFVYMSFSQRLYPVPHPWIKIGLAVLGTAFLGCIGVRGSAIIDWQIAFKIALIGLNLLYLTQLKIISFGEIKSIFKSLDSRSNISQG